MLKTFLLDLLGGCVPSRPREVETSLYQQHEPFLGEFECFAYWETPLHRLWQLPLNENFFSTNHYKFYTKFYLSVIELINVISMCNGTIFQSLTKQYNFIQQFNIVPQCYAGFHFPKFVVKVGTAEARTKSIRKLFGDTEYPFLYLPKQHPFGTRLLERFLKFHSTQKNVGTNKSSKMFSSSRPTKLTLSKKGKNQLVR